MSATHFDVLRHIRSAMAKQATGVLSDQQLLESFLSQQSEAAFTALVQRHGAMVFGVCRRLLRHTQDAEDAFQATFLALAQQAVSIRRHESVGSWLHGVAIRVAAKLKRTAARRAVHEGRLSPRPTGDAMDDITWRELRSVLDEELRSLPEKYRAPLVLCYLEARTQDEAVQQLGWSKSTFCRRLNRARQLLAQRLSRRGLTLPVALTAPLLIDGAATAALPPLLVANTVRAGLALASGQPVTAVASVVALAESGGRPLFMSKVKWALALMVAMSVAAGGVLTHQTLATNTSATQPTAPPSHSPPARSASKDKALSIKGRVLNPEGEPVAGAHLFLLSAAIQKKADSPIRATTDPDGRFRFTAHPEDFGPQGKGKLVATAKGFGLDWIDLSAKDRSEERTLQLVVDDVPIEGRVLDLEGKPVAGATLRVLRVGKMPGGGDLKPWLDKNIEMRRKGTYLNENGLDVIRADLLDLPLIARTAADGSFRLTGFGRDRVVRLDIEGPDIVWRKMWSVTRPGPARGFIPGFWGVYATRFEYLASPCKPIVGTVREKGTGKPLSGITVGSVMHGNVETTTDKEGRYRIVGVAKNPSYTIVAEGKYHFNCTKHDIGDTPGLEPITVNFELERAILVRGRVTNKATGEPIRSSVFYCALADNPNVKDFKEIGNFAHVHLGNPFDTAADGSFTALGIPGPGLLVVCADNGAFVEAKPIDAKGAPLKTVPNIVLTGNHALVSINVSENDPKTQVQDITLDPGRSVKGTVLGPDGQPLLGARVTGLTPVYNRNARESPEQAGLKGADFTVLALAPGQDRQLVFFHPQKNLGKVLRLHGDEKGRLNVRLEPLGALCGRMLTPAGQPLPGLTVLAAVGPGGHKVTATTDKKGKFRVDGLLPQMRYLLVVGYGDPEQRNTIRVYREEGLSVEAGKTKDLGDLKSKQMPGR